jgi:hypothetical protein
MGELSKETKDWIDVVLRKTVDERLEHERQDPCFVRGTGIKREANPVYLEIEDAFHLFNTLGDQ